MLLSEERRHEFGSIESALGPTLARRLARIGVSTATEFQELWQYGNSELLKRFLGASDESSTPRVALASATRGTVAPAIRSLALSGSVSEPIKYARGVPLTAAQRNEMAAQPPVVRSATSASRVPRPHIPLLDEFPGVRNQGDRGTCVAFSSIAFLEYHLQRGGANDSRLSEQFFYWGCKKDDGMARTDGTFVSVARTVLKSRGSCLHSTWRYVSELKPSRGQGPPPDGAEEEAAQNRFAGARRVSSRKVDSLIQLLDTGRPVVISVLTFPVWDLASTEQTGEILMPLPGQKPDAAHAVVLVGYERDERLPGGGVFVFRNSWGTRWARGSRFKAGYGTLFFAYVKRHGLEAYA